MTEKLKNIFNLPENEELKKELIDYEDIKELDKSMKGILDLSKTDEEMDNLSEKALEGYESLMTLGFNSDPRFASPIFEAATKMLGHAITAKTAKVDKKLKALDLKLKERRLDILENDSNKSPEKQQGESLSRNELLEILRKKSIGNDK